MKANYHLKTTYSRRESDVIRSRLASKELSQLREEYLSFYQGYDESTTVDKPVVFEDDLASNIVVSEESYIIEDNAFFRYHDAVSFDADTSQLVLNYQFVTKVDYINPTDFKAYVAALKKVKKRISYGIQKSMPKSAADVENQTSTDSADWMLVGLLVYLGLIVLAFALYRDDKLRNPYTGKMIFYPVSVMNICVYWVATLGFYSIYWYYKNWQYLKQRDDLLCMPFAMVGAWFG
jgi:hypothetical protein